MWLRPWHAYLPTNGYIAVYLGTVAVKMAFINARKGGRLTNFRHPGEGRDLAGA